MAEELKPKTKVSPVLIISMTQDGKVTVQGPLQNKKFCLTLLGDVIKIVANHEPTRIVVPKTGDIPA